MKRTKRIMIALISVLVVAICFAPVFIAKSYAVNAYAVEEEITVPNETETEQGTYEELLEKMNKLAAEIKESKIYQWLTCGLAGVIVAISGVLIRVWGKLRSFKAGYKVSAETANELKDILKNFDKESILKAVNEVVGREIQELCKNVLNSAEVKNTELAKIINENEVIKAQINKIVEALKLAWGNRVEGIEETLAEAPDKTAFDKLVIENKLLKEQIVGANTEQGEITVASIESKAEKEIKGE